MDTLYNNFGMKPTTIASVSKVPIIMIKTAVE